LTALHAKLVRKYLGKANIEDYFLAGLLHDIGLLVLDQFLHERFAQILNSAANNGNDYLLAEKTILGADHGAVGAHLGCRWKLPGYVVDAIRYHHNPRILPGERASNSDIVMQTHFSDISSLENGLCGFVDFFHPPRDNEAIHAIRIPQDKLNDINKQVHQDVSALIKEWEI
jgi:HD-like signal output (HDOD) protein